MTHEYAVLQAEKQLTLAPNENFTTSMNENEIDQLNKLDAVFNTTAKKFRQH